MRSFSRYSSSEWNDARRLMTFRMLRRLSSSSTSSEPVDEPMNTFTPAHPGRRSSSGEVGGVLARAADEEREIAVHAVGGARLTLAASAFALVVAGSVFGISNTVVTPPMTALARAGLEILLVGEAGLAEMHLAYRSRPGSTCRPRQSITCAAVACERSPIAAIRPPAIAEIAHAFAVVVDDRAAPDEEVVALGHSNRLPL